MYVHFSAPSNATILAFFGFSAKVSAKSTKCVAHIRVDEVIVEALTTCLPLMVVNA